MGERAGTSVSAYDARASRRSISKQVHYFRTKAKISVIRSGGIGGDGQQATTLAEWPCNTIIGSLNSPVEQLVQFVQHYQDAQLSLERLNEVHTQPDEEQAVNLLTGLPTEQGISFRNVSFTYPGAGNDPVLTNINLVIPQGKVTAIVGSSGSGKTTLLKLL